MTNGTLSRPRVNVSPELLALAPVGGKRRPVKVVEHPAFRAARAAFEAPYTVVRLPVVSLEPQAPETRVDCTALICLPGAA